MQFGVLKHLAEGAAHTAADLCRRMHYDTGSHDSHSRPAVACGCHA
jgi:hypothetical protein